MKKLCALLVVVLMLGVMLCACDVPSSNQNGSDQVKANGYTTSSLNSINQSGLVKYTAGNSDIEYLSGEKKSEYSRFYTMSYDKISNPKYTRVNGWKYDENANSYNVYLIYLGYVKNVPIAFPYGTGFMFTGNTYEREISKTATTSESIKNAVSSSSEKSFKKTSGWNISASVSTEVSATIANMLTVGRKYDLSVGYSNSTERLTTSAFAESREDVQAHSESLQEMTKLTLDSDSPYGYYRQVVMGQLEVFATVVYDKNTREYKRADTMSIVSAIYDAVDYSSSDPTFSDEVYEPLTLDESIIESLFTPSKVLEYDEVPKDDETPAVVRYTITTNGNLSGQNVNVPKPIVSVEVVDYAVDFGVPTCNNYAFVGWFTSDGKQVTGKDGKSSGYSFTKNMTLYAHWLCLKYVFRDSSTTSNSGYLLSGNEGMWTGTRYGRFGTWYRTKYYRYNVDLPNKIKDLSAYKSLGYNNARIIVTLDIAEKNKGYQLVELMWGDGKKEEKRYEHGGSGNPTTSFSSYTPFNKSGDIYILGNALCVTCWGTGIGKDNAWYARNLTVTVEISK